MTLHLLYLDPGTGSMLVQMVVAGALGALFFVKNGWYKIKSFFTRNKEDKKDETSST